MNRYVCNVVQFFNNYWHTEYMELNLNFESGEFILANLKVQENCVPVYDKVIGTFVDKSDYIILANHKKLIYSESDNIRHNDILKRLDRNINYSEEEDYKEVKDLLIDAVEELKALPTYMTSSKDTNIFYKVDRKSLRIPKNYEYMFDRIFIQ